MNSLLQDLKHGLRLLRLSPGFALAVVLILGLGIGASSTIFSFISSLMIRPLAIEDVGSVIRIYERLPGVDRNQAVSFRNYLDWREQNQVFEEMAVFRFEAPPAYSDGTEADRVPALKASATLFPLLRQQFALGRGFSADEDRPGGPAVVVLTNGFWQRRYGSDPAVIGRTVRIDGRMHTIIGVLAKDPEYFDQAGIWMPLALSSAILRSNHFLTAVGRLKSGVAVERAQQDMNAIALRLTDNKIDDRQLTVFLTRFHDSLLQTVRAPMLLGMAAAGFLFLIACTNAANLILARGVGRSHEIGIRASLGASRRRIIRQLTTESVLLSSFGGALGLLIAYSCIEPLAGLAPQNYRIVDVVIDGRVIAFVVIASILSGIFFGVVPALKVTRPVRFASRHRVRNLLVIGQVALALVLLAGTGLLMESYRLLHAIDAGVDPRNVVTMQVSLPLSKYREALDEVQRIPGVEAAAVAMTLPFTNSQLAPFAVEGGQAVGPSSSQDSIANTQAATPRYFDVMRIPLRAGRLFTDQDDEHGSRVAIINERLASRFWPGGDAVGRRIRVGPPEWKTEWMTIVGVIGNVRAWGLQEDVPPEIYAPFAQAPARIALLAVRTTSDPLTVAGIVRTRLLQIDRDQPVSTIRAMEKIVADSQWQRDVTLMLMTIFAAVALILSSAGLYGVIAYSVNQRQSEIGIRVALGAQRRDILRMAAAEGMKLAITGELVGVLAALALTRFMSGLLYGVAPNDFGTFLRISVLVLVLALIATYIPARRATKIDPSSTLRTI